MGRGNYMQPQVENAIETECSGFELLCSPRSLKSTFVTDIELPAMERRRASDQAFFASASFLRFSIKTATERLAHTPGAALTATLGKQLREDRVASDLGEAAEGVLSAYLRTLPQETLRLRIETFDPLPWRDESDLQLAWWPSGHDGRIGHRSLIDRVLHRRPRGADARDAWQDDLLPGLHSLKSALVTSAKPRSLRVRGNVILSAGLALGFEFRQPTGWSLELEHAHLPCKTALEEPDDCGWSLNVEDRPPAPDGTLVVCVSATHDVRSAVQRHRQSSGLTTRAELHVVPPGGPGRLSLESASANRLAAKIADEIRVQIQRNRTIQTDLYMACPWTFAVLIGWHLAQSGRVVAYELTPDCRSYTSSCSLV